MKNFLVYNGKKDGYNFEISADKNSISGVPPEKKISRLIDENIDYVSGVFYLPDNGDIVLRKFAVDLGEKKVRAFLLSVDGLSDGDSINQFILEPLMNLKMRNADSSDLLNTLEHTLLPQGQITVTDNLKDMALKVNIGNAALVIDGLEKGFIVDVKSWEHRSVDNPENEAVIQGPHEGFNEVLRSNTALIRKTLNTPNLVMENVFLGSTSKTPGALAYVRNAANESLVAEVKKRIENIGAEYILSTLDVEQYIEEATFMPIPQMITTERPDRVCRALTEGRVAVVMNGSSHVLVMPATFFDLITSAEDEYLRYPYSMLIRILRYIAVFVALLFPALFLSVLNFHPSLLPTNLMLAISSSRALVPFGSVVELLIMELAFELIKEAGIRVPGPIGSTLGIVGGLIVGQAAVDANIVSPIMIIIVAVTGIAAFTIPSYSLSFAFRFSRFLYIFGAAVAGFLGVAAVFFTITLAAVGTKSFGVPFLSPLTPSYSDRCTSLIFGAPIWKRGAKREEYLKPKDKYKKEKISRKWLFGRND